MKTENKFFLMLFLAVILLSFITVRPFARAILTAIVLAYIFYPVYSWLRKRVKNESVAAFIVTIVLILLVTIPTVFLLKELTGELFQVYFGLKKVVSGIESQECTAATMPCSMINLYKKFSSDPQLRLPLTNMFSRITVYMIDSISNSLLTLPGRMVELLIIIFSTYYFLKDGKNALLKMENIIPLKKEYKEHLFSRVEVSTRGVIYGNMLVAVLQGALAMAGFYFLGAPQPILFGVLTVFAAVVPMAGAAVIWLPVSLTMVMGSLVQQSNLLLFRGVALFVYGAFLVSSIDNVIKPKVIGEKAKIHPMLVLIGVLGGIKLFGFAGFIIGPTVLTILAAFLDLYTKEKVFIWS